MPIRVECPACEFIFNVRDEYGGKRGKCPQCKGTLEVPPAPTDSRPVARAKAEPESDEGYALSGSGPKVRAVVGRTADANSTGVASPLVARAVEPTRASQTPAQILAAFRGEIEPVRTTVLYRFWIVVAAGLMILLPLAYVALVICVGAAVVLHAIHNVTILQSVGNGRIALFLYAGPLVAGGIVVAFMLKPLFARPGQKPKTRELDPQKEPLVFAFVDGVCASVGAPRPSRIEVDCDVNASARRAGGALALFNNDLVLTIGLPLAAGLDIRQFAGVLAHEFGHFSQGAGMRLSTLIRTINFWFARVVYERDSWDESLAGWISSENNYTIVIGLLAQVAVWITRRVLWVLMMIGHAASGFLLRQMEFDADRYEARMVGGEVFAQTSRRLRVLGLAAQGAYADVASSWTERRLPDNLPKLILANVPQIPEPVMQQLSDAEAQARTGLFDTHPADKDRIARAERERTQGIFKLEGPATDLFRNFDSLARAVTFEHYRQMIGPNLTKDQLYPVAEAIQGQVVNQQGQEAFGRYFLDAFGPDQPLPLPPEYPAAPADLKAAKTALVAARKEMELRREPNKAALTRWAETQQQAMRAEAALALVKAGNRIKAADFGLEDNSQHEVDAAVRKAEKRLGALAAALEPFSEAAARRMSLALAMLESDAVAARVADGSARRAEARALYPSAAALGGRLISAVPPVIRGQQAVIDIVQRITQSKAPNNPGLHNGLFRASGILHERLRELHWKTEDAVVYPFEHALEQVSLRRFILPSVPPSEAIGDLANTSGEAIEKTFTLYRRLLGRLAVTAEEVERALGLPPLTVKDQAEPEIVTA